MASKASSGLPVFLRLGVPCAAPTSPLGGDGRLGAISAALALSSRNLSNSGGIVSKRENKAEVCEAGLAEIQLENYRGRDLCCPTFTCHALLAFISFLLKSKENEVTPGSWLYTNKSTTQHHTLLRSTILTLRMFPKTRFNQSTTAPRSFQTLNKKTLTRRYHLPSILQTILEIITISIDVHLQNTMYTKTNPPVVSSTKTAGYHRSIMQHSLGKCV